MAASALSPLAAAVFGVLQDATLQAATAGGWHDDVPQPFTLPIGWVELFDETDRRGLGTGELNEIEVRLHVFSEYGGMSEAQEINRQAVALLKDATLTISGYTHCGNVFWDRTVRLPSEELNGRKVCEVVSFYRVIVQA